MSQTTSPTTTSSIDLAYEMTKGVAYRMIQLKAGRLIGHGRFTENDREDLAQQLTLALLEVVEKFDPTVAKWPVFVTTIVERTADKILRRRKSPKSEHSHHVTSLSGFVQDEDGETVALSTQIGDEHREALTGRYRTSEQEVVEIKDGISILYPHLRKETQAICETMSEQSLTEAARDHDIPRTTVRLDLERARELFEKHGF